MPDIPVGAIVELRHSKDDWRVVSHYDELPRFVRQYNIVNERIGEKKRVFLHEIFEKNTTTYEELKQFFREQSKPKSPTPLEHETEHFMPPNEPDSNEMDWDEVLTQEFDTSFNEGSINVTESGSDNVTETATEENANVNISSRFKKVTNSDVEAISSKNTEKTTDSQTKWAVKLLKEWLSEMEPTKTNFESLDTAQLDDLLGRFYASLQTKKGKDYSNSALVGLRAGINRYLTSPPHQRQMNLMKDRQFMKSNQVLTGLIKQMKREGKDTSENKEPISHNDLKKLQQSGQLSTENPKSLQNKVIFDIMTHFGRRGREGLRSLTKESFKIATDSDGHRYVAMAYNECDKTHHGIDSRETNKQPRMSETKTDTCPLKSYEKYISKLNPDCKSFFQRPLTHFNEENWYAKVPVGLSYLYNFMSRLSNEAGLSKCYTNHCIRAMVASNLCEAGISNQGIMSVTGHRNVQSLNSYIKPSDKERRVISGILANQENNALALRGPSTCAGVDTSSFQPHFPNYPSHNNSSGVHQNQFSSQSSTLNIFSGNISGGNVTVHVYKQ